MSTSYNIAELGPDADLLVHPEEYIDHHLTHVAAQIGLLSEQYDTLRRARRIKRELQQQNRVAVRIIERDAQNRIVNVSIKVMPLPDAINLLNRDKSDVNGERNLEAQFTVWRADGYDIETSATLR